MLEPQTALNIVGDAHARSLALLVVPCPRLAVRRCRPARERARVQRRLISPPEMAIPGGEQRTSEACESKQQRCVLGESRARSACETLTDNELQHFDTIRSSKEMWTWLADVVPQQLFVNNSDLRMSNYMPGWVRIRMQQALSADVLPPARGVRGAWAWAGERLRRGGGSWGGEAQVLGQ